MISCISFLNNTGFSYISVVEDEKVLVEILPKNQVSKKIEINSGSVSFEFFKNSPKPFLNVYIPLYPGESYTLAVYENFAEFI